MVHEKMTPTNLAKNQREVYKSLGNLTTRASELSTAQRNYAAELRLAKEEMRQAEGKELRLKGLFVVARWRGGYDALYPTPGILPPAQYQIGTLQKLSIAEHLPAVDVLWLIPTDPDDRAERYGAQFDTLQSASIAEVKATYSQREVSGS